jgi:dipeptidyl aminopeptidase/acylaminoacyl peptidase
MSRGVSHFWWKALAQAVSTTKDLGPDPALAAREQIRLSRDRPRCIKKQAISPSCSSTVSGLRVAVSGRLLVVAKLVLGIVVLAASPAFSQALPGSIHAEGVPLLASELGPGLGFDRFSEVVTFQGWLAGTRRVVYLNESDGIPQVFVSSRPDGGGPERISFGRPVSWVAPDPARERLVVAFDSGGNENYQLHLLDLLTGSTRVFTNQHWRNSGLLWSPRGQVLALTSNARNGKDRDLYVVKPPHVQTGRRIMDAVGTCFAQDWSPDGRRLAVVEHAPDLNTSRVHLIDVGTGAVQTIPQPDGRPVKRTDIRWARDAPALYWLTDRDSEFVRLARYELGTNQETPLTAHISWDVEEYALSGNGKWIVLVVNADGYSQLQVIDARNGAERLTLRPAPGRIANIGFRGRSQEFAYTWSSALSPPAIYSYDIAARWVTEWVVPGRDDTRARPGHEPELIRYPTFDGRAIPALVRRPDPDDTGPSPVLIELHGGPDAQARPRFSPLAEFLLNELGIALIAPNVRGSSGYGRSYEALDDGLKREDAVRDIGALLDWIETQPGLDASRVAVSGNSYGGYLALAAMVRYGDRLRAGIDISGISHLETFLRDAPPIAIEGWRDEFGDEHDPELLAFFRRTAPLASADRIRKPLLVIHGASDPRVNIAEAEQIVQAVRNNNVPVWYVRFEGEGHRLQMRLHTLYAQHAQIRFLSEFLLPME